MKRKMSIVVCSLSCLGAVALFAAEPVAVTPAPAALAAPSMQAEVNPVAGARPVRPAVKCLTPEERQAMRERRMAEREAWDKAEAEKRGVTVEEYRRCRADEMRARREKREQALAAKEGLTVVDYRAKRKARHEEMSAKRLGVSVEQFRAMKPEEIKARDQELAKKRAEERRARIEKMKEERAAKAAEGAKAPAAVKGDCTTDAACAGRCENKCKSE